MNAGAALTREHVEVNGRTISYLRTADGAPQHVPLVLLHGIGGNASQFVQQLAGLADLCDIIAWDAPGYGGSDDPGADWQMEDWSDALDAFLTKLGFEDVVLLGQSWGGVLAQITAARHPQRVRALVLSDTSMGGGAQPAEQAQATLAARLRALDEMTPAEMAEARTPAVLGPNPGEEAYAAARQMMSEIRPDGYRRAAIALAAANTQPLLASVQVPTLILCGAHDGIVPPATARELQAAISGATLVELPHAGHLGGQEDPQRYNAALREFITATAAARAG